MANRPIPEETWHDIVRSVPIVSVDLVVRHDGGVVLGRREHPPAEGDWFVPGGRVRKGETIDDAIHRIARTELGVDVTIDRRLGVYEHFWDESEFDDIETKQYLPVGAVVTPETSDFTLDDQHAEIRTFTPPFTDVHPYVEAYLRDAGLLD